MDRNTSFQSKQSKPSRPTRPNMREQTASTLRPRMTRLPTTATQTTGGSVAQGGYSLAGNRPPGPDRQTYVENGYRQLNPEYERQDNTPTFSLGSNLPRTVRGWQQKKANGAKDSTGAAPGVNPREKGEEEVAPQLQNVDERKTRDGRGSSGQNAESAQSPQTQGTSQSQQGGMMFRQARVRDDSGNDLGIIADQPVFSPSAASEDEKTLAPEEDVVAEEAKPFNAWALVRAKFQDALGEWLGTTIFVALGVSSNLAVATGESQHPGIYQSMYWGWGLAVMLGIYISGGSSGAHLNPAISIPLWIYRGFPARKLPVFVMFQILGAFCGGLIAILIYRDAILYADGGLIPSSTGIQIYTQPKEYVKPATAFFTEFVGTAILTCSILALGDDSNSPPGAGMHAFIIGLLVTVLIMALGSNTGGAFNPARDFGPRLAAMALGYPASEVFTAYHNWWIWGAWGATMSGSLCGGVLYDLCIFKGGESPVNFSPQRWQGKANESKLDFLQMLRQNTRARGLEEAMEKGEVENGAE